MQRLRQLLLIKQGEGGKTSFFMFFFLLVGVGLAIGKGSADALFIKRFGVEYFPVVYMFLSIHLAVFSLAYAAYVDRLSAESFQRIIFYSLLFILAIVVLLMQFYDFELVYPVYYILYAIAAELLVSHGAFYMGQNFDTLQAKRLTPLIFAGYQTGMIIGGLVLIFLVPVIGLDKAPLVWAGFLFLASMLVWLWHKRHGVSPYYFHVVKSSRHSRFSVAFNEIKEGFNYTRRTPLLKYAAWATFFMVLTFYMLSYISHSIYTSTFEDENELAEFFGVLVIATNVGAMLIQMLLSNKIIDRFGIRKANYIYPFTTVLSFVFLLLNPGFYAALFASFNRETILPAIRTPTRQLFFNVLPDNMKGRARAISVAIVVPLALFACGAIIQLSSFSDGITVVVAIGLFCALTYMLFTVKMGNEYIATLVNSMKEKLYLPDAEDIKYTDADDKVLHALQAGLLSDNKDVSLSYAKALIKAYPKQAVKLILERVKTLDVPTADQMIKLIDKDNGMQYIDELESALTTGDAHFKATVFDILIDVHSKKRTALIQRCLRDTNPRLQVSGIYAAYLYAEWRLHDQAYKLWCELLAQDENSHFASLRLIPLLTQCDIKGREFLLSEYSKLIPHLLTTDDMNKQIATINSLRSWEGELPADIRHTVLQDAQHESPYVRASVAKIIYQLVDEASLEDHIWVGLSDGHVSVRKATLAATRSAKADHAQQYFQWLLENDKGAPRAHLCLVEELLATSVSYDMLEKIIISKARYAAQLLCAIDNIPESHTSSNSNTAAVLLKTALQERAQQINDLMLLALQPLSDRQTLRVIRAGLNSSDERHKANAIEALEGLDSRDILELVSDLVKRDSVKVLKQGYGQVFKNYQDVVQWCAQLDDRWVSECGAYALRDLKVS